MEQPQGSLENMEVNKEMQDKFWKNKKVLITGYEGFLGSHLSKTLLDALADIYGLDILTGRKETILAVKDLSGMNITRGSVEDYDLVYRIIRQNKIEFIFHLAATSIVREALDDPLRAFASNIKGTWNILEAARQAGNVKAVIIASSDKAYGAQSKLPYCEDSPLCGSHPYDVSKSCADLLAHTYFHTYNLAVSVTRCGNIFGPGDFNFSRIVPETISSVLGAKTLIIRSDGKFTRDYIYVKDVVWGYLLLARKMSSLGLFGEAFNFSNEEPISVLGLVKAIFKLAGKKPDYKIANRAKYEIRHQYLSAAKAKRLLKWKPVYGLAEGLKETIKWYREYFLEKY
jgi:CDP-glucose 4,6-dehydratase